MMRRVGPMATHSPARRMDGVAEATSTTAFTAHGHRIYFLVDLGSCFYQSFFSFLSFTHSSFLASNRSGVWRLIGAGWGLVKVRSIWERGDMADGRGFVFVFFWHRAWARLLGIFACIGHGQSDRRGFLLVFSVMLSSIPGSAGDLVAPLGPKLVHPAYGVPDIGGEGYAMVTICDRRF